MDVCLVAGARPDFVKVAPIVRAINNAKAGGDDISYKLVYMGAECDHTLEQSLYCDLGMPAPDVFLGIECDNLNELAGLSMAKFDAYLSENHTDLVLVVDDLASTMAVAIATKKRGILLAHIVAGTRSFDMSMPKEINRLVIDGLSDFLFTADSNSSSIATREGAQLSHIYMVGNVLVDSLRYNCNRLEKPELFGQLGMGEGDYIVFTVNRKAVLGDAKLLEGIAQTVQAAAGGVRVVAPLRGVAKQVLEEILGKMPNFTIVPPLPYLEFGYLLSHSKGIVTDSGNIAEEATFYGIPCATVNTYTEHKETVTRGTNVLVGENLAQLKEAVADMCGGRWKNSSLPEMWDGRTAERIVKILTQIGH